MHTRRGNPVVFSDLEHVSSDHSKHMTLRDSLLVELNTYYSKSQEGQDNLADDNLQLVNHDIYMLCYQDEDQEPRLYYFAQIFFPGVVK